MKVFCTGLGLLLFSGVFAQNNVPQLSGLSANVDTATKEITIYYTVSDAENDSLEIGLSVSNTGGQTYYIPATNLTGDVGFPVFSGSNKQLVWDYSALSGSGSNYRIKLVANDRKALSIQNMVDQVDSVRLRNTMNIIEGTRHYSAGAAHLQDIKDTIYGRFNQFNLSPVFQNFQYGSYQAQNIIGKRAGQFSESTVFIVDGHYDCVSNGPGADDNGSAVIGVLEAARILSQYEFKNSIRFIGFDLEELGLRGSIEYVLNGIEDGENVSGVLNYEMIGYYSNRNNSQVFPTGFNLLFPAAYAQVAADTFKGNFITNVANQNSSSLRQKFDACAAQYVPGLRVVSFEAPGNSEIAQDLRRSDHAPFWDAGNKALMITDGAEFRNHNYHTVHDVSDSLDFGFIQQVVKATVATLAELAIPIHAGSETLDVQILNVPASISTWAANEPLVIKPNPADEQLIVEWDNAQSFNQIQLLDMNGQVVYKAFLQNNSQHRIQTDGFASGMYVLQLIGSSNQSKKVMIAH